MSKSDESSRGKFYFSRGSRVLGPISSGQLKAMASAGKILPTDVVWMEGGSRKVPASTIKGLFVPCSITEGSRTDGAARSSKTASIPPARTKSTMQAKPLIRITRIDDVFKRGFLSLFHGYQITGVFEDAIAVGKSIRYPRLDDEDCSSDGLVKYMERQSFRKAVPMATITGANLTGSVRNSLFGPLIEPYVRLELRTNVDATSIYFHRRDVAHLKDRLLVSLGQRLELGVRNRTSVFRLLVEFVLLFIVFIILNVATLTLIASPWMIPLNALVAFFVVYAIHKALNHRTKKELPFDILTAPIWPPPKNSGSKIRQPLRSKVFGNGLKLIAFAWLLVALIYLPMRVHAYVLANPNDRQMRDMSMGSVVSVLSIPSVILLYLGHGLTQIGASTAKGNDRRRPILFLRSFALDGKTTLQPDTALAAFLGVSGTGSLKTWFTQVLSGMNLLYNLKFTQCVHPLRLIRLFLGLVADTTEQSVVRFFSKMGPVHAIGRPGENIAETGAYREYVADDEWQSVVLRHLDRCQAVILQPSQTEGMRWEIHTVLNRVALEKVLIVFSGGPGMADDYEHFKSHIEGNSPLRLPLSLPFRKLPVVLWFERDGTVRSSEVSYASPVSWIFRGDAVDLDYTLQPFAQGIHGGERETPRVIRPHAWYEYLGAWGIAVLWLVVCGIWITQGRGFQSYATYSASPSRNITGSAFPYRVEIPESWVPSVVSQPAMEHEFSKTGVGFIKIVAHGGREDMSRLPEQLATGTKANSGILGQTLLSNVVVESTQKRAIGDRDCIEIRLRNELRSGGKEFQRIIAYSGDDGTFFINVISTKEIAPGQEEEIARILNSVAFSRSYADIQTQRRGEIVRRFNDIANTEVQTIRGKSVGYTLRVPRTWKSVESPDPIVEFMYRIPNGGILAVIAHAGEEEIATLGDQLLIAEATEFGDKGRVVMENSDDVRIQGFLFKRLRLVATLNDGTKVTTHCVAHSSTYGTLLLKGSIVEMKSNIEEQLVLTEVLNSVRVNAP